MGKSITINCIGMGPAQEDSEGTIRRRVYEAMTKGEIVQEIAKAKKRGEVITHWYCQTKAGEEILRPKFFEDFVKTEDIKLPKLPKCPVCNGQGIRPCKGDIYEDYCVVCRGSGICRKGSEKNWRPWQIQMMKDEFKN